MIIHNKEGHEVEITRIAGNRWMVDNRATHNIYFVDGTVNDAVNKAMGIKS